MIKKTYLLLGIFLLVLSLNFISAANSNIDKNVTADSGWTTTAKTLSTGVKFVSPSYTVYLINITKANAEDATRATVRWRNNSTVIAQTTTLSGNTFIFSTPVPLSGGNQTFYWLLDKQNASYTLNYKTGSYPIIQDGWFNQSVDDCNITTSSTCTEAKTNYHGIVLYGIANYSEIINTLNFPTNNSIIATNISNLFNWTVTSNVYTLVNTTLYINDIYNETINISGLSNTTTTSKIFGNLGNYNWTISSCNGVTCSNSSTYYFNVSEVGVNSLSYESLVYDTQKKAIWINLSNSPSVSTITASLEYNNTNYSMTNFGTVSNALFNVTFDLPNVNSITNKTFRFYFTYTSTSTGANVKTYGDFNQSVNATTLALCSASNNIGYLNLSFKDETNSSVLNAAITSATFDYYLGDGTTYKTLTFSNTSNNYYYSFCSSASNNTLNIDPFVQYKQGTAYPQRTWNPTVISYANTTTNQTLYLLNSATGIYSTIQVQDIIENALSGVTVSAESYVGGLWILTGSGTTGSDGGVTFWLNPDSQARINASKTGYDSVSTIITPTQSGYTITLGGGTSAAAFDYSKGITYYIQPTMQSLVNDTSYTFSFYIHSTYWNLTYYYFNITNENGITYGSNYGTTSSGSNITRSINTGTNQSFCINYYWTANSTNSTASRCWIIFDTSQNRFSLYNLFSDLGTYISTGLYGLDNFGVGLLCFLIIVMVTGTLKMKWGISDESVLIGVVFGVVSLLDVGFSLIPTPLNAVPHFATVLMALIFISFLYKEVFQ